MPLNLAKIQFHALMGAHSDLAMISGGGSAQVDPPNGNAFPPPPTPLGAYTVRIGGSSQNLPLSATVTLGR